jgi:hypothetical protein
MKIVGVLALAALAAGCAQSTGTLPSGASMPSLARPAWWHDAPASVRAGVYVTQANGAFDGVVFGFKAQNKANESPLCSIANQTFGETQIAADAAHNVYVPNAGTNSIDVYAPNCGALVRSISDPFSGAVDVTVHGSTIYAAGGTNVAVCTNTGCSSALTDPSIFQLETAAVDSQGNVWASYYDQKFAISLVVWPGGAMPGHVVSGYVNQNTPGDLIFDKSDTLVSIQTRFTHAYVYTCSASKARCANTRTIGLKSGSVFGSLNARNTDIQITDYTNRAVDVYAYPSFAYQYSYSKGLMPGYSVEGIVQTH